MADRDDALLTGIERRRSVRHVAADPEPTRAQVERLLAVANMAPNHHLTQPWRFWVLRGRALTELGEMMAVAAGEDDQARERARVKPLRAPLLIAVGIKAPEPRAVPIEDVLATGAAVENLLLAATALGLGAMWRTGKEAYDPEVKRFFGLSAEEHLAGWIYLGLPAEREPEERPRVRRPVEELTEWRGWEA